MKNSVNIVVFTFLLLLVLLLLGLYGCTVGRAPGLAPGEIFNVTREVSGTQVKLSVSKNDLLMRNDEVVIIAEKVSDGVEIIDGSWGDNEPLIWHDGTIIWLFALNPPQVIEENINVNQKIPDVIEYSISSPIDATKIEGKWGLVRELKESKIINIVEDICSEYDLVPPDGINSLDIVEAIERWADGIVDSLFILRVIEAWANC